MQDDTEHSQAFHQSVGSTQPSFEEEHFIAFDIQEFSIYRPHKARIVKKSKVEETPSSNELMGLHETDDRGINHWYVDGWICYGPTRKFIQRVRCETLSIGGYEDIDWHTVGSALWIQSITSRKSGIWYCLKKPAQEYRPYHETFLWLADMAKHLVDYLYNHRNVSLHALRNDFYNWVFKTHQSDPAFQQWLRIYSDTDFRRVLTAHACFLSNQAIQLGEEYANHPIWTEVSPFGMDAVPNQAERLKLVKSLKHGTIKPSTVVTRYVYDCFKHLPWAKFLDIQDPAPVLRRKQVNSHAGFSKISSGADATTSKITTGDVIVLNSDPDTKWKSHDTSWFGYVQAVSSNQNENPRLGLLWLYRPSDTSCQRMRYPKSKELFLSDHCNCEDEPIYAEEVVSKLNVTFYGNGDKITTTNAEYFVRQKYSGDEGAWTSLTEPDFICVCRKPKGTHNICVGDTWLVAKSKSGRVLEPVELLDNDNVNALTVRVRRLDRLGRDYAFKSADSNELVYSSTIESIAKHLLIRPCYVRFYTIDEKHERKVPVPYCSGGTGDFYYISYWENNDGCLKPLQKPYPVCLRQGFDPSVPRPCPSMKGLDIFCGGGTFGRGLEDGGAVEMRWAIDYFREAIHTYRANARDPEETKLFYGSVNDYLSQAMRGERDNNLIAQPGEVEVIAAGSPCQGFSSINMTKSSNASLINVSVVASVVSYVDFYRPKYALLENVPGMARSNSKHQDDNVFAQVICALVGMGYQVRSFLLDAWNFGAPQSRTRLFISIAAPGLTPLPDPPQSHSHPIGLKARALGKTANGLPTGTRYWGPTSFEHITIEEATKDLPLNQHGKSTCIRHPDHRLSRNVNALNQGRIECIPKHPKGMNFIKAVKLGVMARPQIEAFSWDNSIRSGERSTAWQRVIPNALISTITTSLTLDDGIAGKWLHWEADRPMTIMEARRAQGFPDYEVIVGAPAMQWKIVGNSVARPVALVLGLALRQAWLSNDVSRIAAACQEPVGVGETWDSNQEEEMDRSQEHTGAPLDSDAETPDPRASESTEEPAPTQGPTRAHDQKAFSAATPRTKASKARVFRPAAPPADTFTKRLRSTLSTDAFVQLPKKRRQPPAHSTIDSAIEISSDDDAPLPSTVQSSQTGTKGTTTPEGDSKGVSRQGENKEGGLLGSSPVGKLLKMGQDLAKSLG